MKVLVATDAWHPQINGVVRSLEMLAAHAPALGAEISFLTPEGLRTIGLPTYSEIRLAVTVPSTVARRIEAAEPDHIHIATEGPLGILARRWCLNRKREFTTSYHTRFPEYLSARLPVPQALTYRFLRRFHNAGAGTMVSTDTLERELTRRGFRNLRRWSRGVDTDLFRPRPDADLDLPRPVFLYVGRIAVEKNVEAFLALDLPGTKVVVGDGPQRIALSARYPDVRFLGVLEGEALANVYAAADVFVFPSKTDTFGMVLLEALAAGVPVAAFPVMGPVDVIGAAPVGALDADLQRACLDALAIPRAACREFALRHSWRESARQFLDHVRLAEGLLPLAAE